MYFALFSLCFRQVLYLGRRIPLEELDARIDAVTAKSVRDACYKYVYDKCPALASVGKCYLLRIFTDLRRKWSQCWFSVPVVWGILLPSAWEGG